VTERSDTLGISPNSSPREVVEEAIDEKELEKLSVALSKAVSVDSSEHARRRDGRYS
jgi:hypothetical protein